MSLAKVLEIFAEGNTIENAVENAIKDASKTVDQIKGIYIKDIKADVDNNAVTRYRINAKITFVIN